MSPLPLSALIVDQWNTHNTKHNHMSQPQSHVALARCINGTHTLVDVRVCRQIALITRQQGTHSHAPSSAASQPHDFSKIIFKMDQWNTYGHTHVKLICCCKCAKSPDDARWLYPCAHTRCVCACRWPSDNKVMALSNILLAPSLCDIGQLILCKKCVCLLLDRMVVDHKFV